MLSVRGDITRIGRVGSVVRQTRYAQPATRDATASGMDPLNHLPAALPLGSGTETIILSTIARKYTGKNQTVALNEDAYKETFAMKLSQFFISLLHAPEIVRK